MLSLAGIKKSTSVTTVGQHLRKSTADPIADNCRAHVVCHTVCRYRLCVLLFCVFVCSISSPFNTHVESVGGLGSSGVKENLLSTAVVSMCSGRVSVCVSRSYSRMLVNKAGNVVDLAVDDHPEIISVLVLGDLLEGEDLGVGGIGRNGGSGRHFVSRGWRGRWRGWCCGCSDTV